MAIAKKQTKADVMLLATLQAYADTLDICDCSVEVDCGTVFLVRTVRGCDGKKYHEVGRVNHPAEWIRRRMKSIESGIDVNPIA